MLWYDRSVILEGILNACGAWAAARLFDHALASRQPLQHSYWRYGSLTDSPWRSF
jgi:hypothetical protein